MISGHADRTASQSGPNLGRHIGQVAFVGPAANAASLIIAQRQPALDIELHQCQRRAVGDEGRCAPDGARPFLDIEQRNIALGGGVEFQDLGDAKAFLERLPDVRAQSVAATKPEPGRGLARQRRRGIEKIPAHFADVLEHRAIVAPDVFPERAGREFVTNDHRAAIDQDRPGRYRAADAVIHRQAVVHAVARLRLHHAGEPMGPIHQPEMADDRCLRQAGGAGRVDVERTIIEGHLRPLRGGESTAREFRNLLGDVGQCRLAAAMRPHDGLGRKVRRCACEKPPAISRATMMCRGETASMQWASEAPTR